MKTLILFIALYSTLLVIKSFWNAIHVRPNSFEQNATAIMSVIMCLAWAVYFTRF